MYVGIYVCVFFFFFLLSTTEASQFDSANGTHDTYLSCDAAFSLCQGVVAQLGCGCLSNSNHSNSTNELTKAEGIEFFVVSLLLSPLSLSFLSSLLSSSLLSLSLLSLLLSSSLLSLSPFSPPLSPPLPPLSPPLLSNPFFHPHPPPPSSSLVSSRSLLIPSSLYMCIYQQVSRHSLIPSSPTIKLLQNTKTGNGNLGMNLCM